MEALLLSFFWAVVASVALTAALFGFLYLLRRSNVEWAKKLTEFIDRM